MANVFKSSTSSSDFGNSIDEETLIRLLSSTPDLSGGGTALQFYSPDGRIAFSGTDFGRVSGNLTGTITGVLVSEIVNTVLTDVGEIGGINVSVADLFQALADGDLAAANALFYGGADSMQGALGSDTFRGWAGNDTLRGGDGNDFLFGDAGFDSLFGDNGNDVLSGGIGNDKLQGGLGADTLLGGVGDDVLTGGSGKDILVGGRGADKFVFTAFAQSGSSYQTADVIRDFQSGIDKIVLTGIDADSITPGVQTFTAPSDVMSATPGSIYLQVGSFGCIANFNTDTDLTPEFVLVVGGAGLLPASDFIF
jgi:Ca2+-binding RTX toxin-like protein